MENSIRIIKQIEATHKGLGIPILFGDVCMLAKISEMIVGEIGTGKGTIIRSMKYNGIDPEYDITMNTITYTELASRIATAENKTMIWRLPEWSTMQKYHRELFLTLGSQIITDKGFYHEMGERKGVAVVIDIKNCDLMTYIGIQPLKMSRMMRENENWESLASDRFVKFTMINPLREDSVESLPSYELNAQPFNPELPIDTTMPLLRKLINTQVSEERVPIFCRHLIRGFCALEGYETATYKAEMEFCQLFRPYLETYQDMIHTQDIEEEKTFASGAYRLFLLISRHPGMTIEEIRDKFRIYNKIIKPGKFAPESYEKMILRHANLLNEAGYIEIVQNSPTKFYMSKKFTDYFNWYKEISK